ncbi:MAG: 16S rRNA (cytosine(1402)-N(4))-methyltransferase, partial [Candidatus Omnitrophota bacterium]
MCREAVEHLSLKKSKVVIDCTIGLASHSLKFFDNMNENSFLIGIDKDEDSLKLAQERLKAHQARFRLFNKDFRDVEIILDSLNIETADAIFFDLGISSFQLFDSQRGFSFSREGPLDMRMDKHSFLSAYDLINHLSEMELNKI